ncbi:NUDIX hydrolase [Actinomycetospora termitidis]|uniref:NUDIX domain-containing protein n=1 Tax=Actinomycetospora termitidis TaxID=3053470 RepID=A0ABT7M9Q8_9PSEU|nr:NUDIX domain-containing protein [Actinomycetospora sp. Odt1-22]MDL5156929.1 NUDIX domain-containing protein [Actinomycetospora sp. Odt1-22]
MTIPVPDERGALRRTRPDELRWRPSAYAIVLRAEEILLLPYLDGVDLPGGGIEFGESLEAGLLRELKEETDLDGYDPVLVGAASSYFRFDDDCVQSVMLYYRVLVHPGQPSAANLSDAERDTTGLAQWHPVADLPDLHLPSTVDWRAYVPAARELSR